MKKNYFLGPLLLCIINLAAQPTIQWQQSVGTTSIETTNCISPTTDGGYVMTGTWGIWGNVLGSRITKLNSVASVEWQISFGASNFHVANKVQQTTDGGYIVIGFTTDPASVYSDTSPSTYDYWLMKLNSAGGVEWEKLLGGSANDYGRSVRQTVDGGFIVVGESYSTDRDVTGHHSDRRKTPNSDYWVAKLTGTGNVEWQKSLGGTKDDIGTEIRQTTDGGFILAGYSYSDDGNVTGHHAAKNSKTATSDCWIVKLTNAGNIQWQKSAGSNGLEAAYAVEQTNDGGYIFAGLNAMNGGDVNGNHGNNDYWIVKVNFSGNIQWQKSLGGSNADIAYSLCQTYDGGFLIGGYSSSTDGDVSGNHGTEDYWIVKLNPDGNMTWAECFGGSNSDICRSLQQTSDEGYILGGTTNSVDGDVTGNHGGSDSWIVKLNPEASNSKPTTKSEKDLPKIHIYPNPAIGKTKLVCDEIDLKRDLKFLLYNAVGQPAKEISILSSVTNISLDELKPGNYVYIVTDKHGVIHSGKLIIL